jgi:hypothetical protein
MAHHDRTSTAIRSTNSISSNSIRVLYATEKMGVVFVEEDGDGDGVERGRKARCWCGRGPGGGREGGKEGMGGGWCLSFGMMRFSNMFILSYRWLSLLDQQIDYFPIPSSNEPSASSFLGP